MTFDDRLRDELRRATASPPFDTDAALAAVRGAPASPDAGQPTVAALEDVVLPRRRVRTRRLVGAAAAIALVIAAIAIPLALRDESHDAARPKRSDPKHLVDTRPALRAVASALAATTGVGSFRVAYTITSSAPRPGTTFCNTETPAGVDPCGVVRFTPVTTTGYATVNVDPYALISVSHVSNFGNVTVRADDTSVWEQGGVNYGLDSGGITGPGQPLSGFASLVEQTLGPRGGAGAMMGLASPYGYLSVVGNAITGAEQTGTGTVNGEPVTIYRVAVDPSGLAAVPGLSAEQKRTIDAAVAVLQREGFTENTTDVSVNERGFVVRTVSVNHFADGGTVTGDNTLSAFGCAGAISMPGRATTVTVPTTCADGSAPPPREPATTVPPTNDGATVTVAPATPTSQEILTTTPRTLSTIDPRTSTSVPVSSGESR